jgi:hypothetical protein
VPEKKINVRRRRILKWIAEKYNVKMWNRLKGIRLSYNGERIMRFLVP